MNNIVFHKKKSSGTTSYAIGLFVLFIIESLLLIAICRIWFDWDQVIMILTIYYLVACIIIYWGVIAPAIIPSLLTDTHLIITFGHGAKLAIPKENIEIIRESNEKIPIIFPFGMEKDKKTQKLFMVTGDNKLYIKLNQPIKAQSLFKSYGYADEIIFNVDDTELLRNMIIPLEREKNERFLADSKKIIIDYHDKKNTIKSDEIVLSLKNVSKYYGEHHAVKDISLDLYNGEIFGFLGANGAGKTTTMKMISNLLKPTSGSIYSKATIAYMPENVIPYERMTGREFLLFLSTIYKFDINTIKDQIDNYLKDFDMQNSGDRIIGTYSQGMKRKITFIATLLKNSRIILLDEPTNGLDPTGIIQVKKELFKKKNLGKTILLSTHILDFAEKLCDRIGIIAEGRVVYVGTVSDLKDEIQMDNSSLEEIFIQLIKGDD